MTPPPAPPGPDATEQLAEDLQDLPLDEFYAESFEALITRTPEAVVWEALESEFPLQGVMLDNLEDGFQRETYSMHQVVLDALHGYDRDALTADEQLDFDIYEYFLRDEIDRLEFIYHDFRATFMNFSVQRRTERFFADIHPVDRQQDAEDYIARLQLVDDKFDQLIDHLNRQRDTGIVEPALTINVALDQVTAIANGGIESNPYYSRFADKVREIPGLDDADRADLLERARAAISSSVTPPT